MEDPSNIAPRKFFFKINLCGFKSYHNDSQANLLYLGQSLFLQSFFDVYFCYLPYFAGRLKKY